MTEAIPLCCDNCTADLSEASQLQKSLSKLVRLFCTLTRAEVNPLGITVLQGYTLMGLQINGPMTMTEISAYTRLAASTMTRVVDKLVKAGLVEREHDERDRRMIRLQLTKAGENKSAEFRLLQSLLYHGLLRELPTEERDHVLLGLTILTDRLEQLAERYQAALEGVGASLMIPELVWPELEWADAE